MTSMKSESWSQRAFFSMIREARRDISISVSRRRSWVNLSSARRYDRRRSASKTGCLRGRNASIARTAATTAKPTPALAKIGVDVSPQGSDGPGEADGDASLGVEALEVCSLLVQVPLHCGEQDTNGGEPLVRQENPGGGGPRRRNLPAGVRACSCLSSWKPPPSSGP